MIKWIDRLMKMVDALSDEMPKDAWTAFWMAACVAGSSGLVFYWHGWRGAWPIGYILAYAAIAMAIFWIDNLRGDQRHRIANLMIGMFLIFYSSYSLTWIGPAGLVSVPTWWFFWVLTAMGIPAGLIILAHTLVHWRDARAETNDGAKCDK